MRAEVTAATASREAEWWHLVLLFFFQAEDGIRDMGVTGVQTCALPISAPRGDAHPFPATEDHRRSRRHPHAPFRPSKSITARAWLEEAKPRYAVVRVGPPCRSNFAR